MSRQAEGTRQRAAGAPASRRCTHWLVAQLERAPRDDLKEKHFKNLRLLLRTRRKASGYLFIYTLTKIGKQLAFRCFSLFLNKKYLKLIVNMVACSVSDVITNTFKS